ncbi:two pore channel protein 1-like [Saccostrea echinata]|uniref:two pore channel protein 1-like n=1 Tax=Saccostrea echinata TaxID=191078 RepID=UPI002A839910|nr:two pore channel protein 1-like [Saccostrea echinata]
MAGNVERPLNPLRKNRRTSSLSESEYEIVNDTGNMGYEFPISEHMSRRENRKLWELNYQEAAIFLQEGENNDKFYTHPRSCNALPAYQIAHHQWFKVLDLVAALGLLFLAACERPAVPFLTLPVGVHGSLEILGQLILALQLAIKLRWLGWKTFFKHKRTAIKSFTLTIMFIESVVVLIRQTNHFRVTRALRPLFLIDTHYFRGVRRISRQILMSLPPILELIFLLMFFILIFSILGFYLFSGVPNDTYFSTIQDSFISLFVLLTTANFPDVMMPAYADSRWNAAFFIVYLALVLYFLMNLLLAVVYDTFSNLEKRKLKRLYFHKRTGCQHAFKLLVTKQDNNKVNIGNFMGMLKYFKPKKKRLEAYLSFKTLNTSKVGKLSLEEFYSVFSVLDLQWKPKQEEFQIWSSNFRHPFNFIFRKLNDFINWRWFEVFIYLVIAANFIWILVETISLSKKNIDVKHYNFTITWASIIFVCIYTMEASIKILAKGPLEYFTTGWDVFDFLVTVTSVIGLLGEYFNDSFFYITVLRPFRLLRLFKMKRSYRDVLGTLFILFSRLLSLVVVIMLVYYFFAIIAMECFLYVDLKNCCKNTSVEAFYKFSNNTNSLGYYYLNDFSNILISGVTLFELTVVNNWFIIMEGFAHHTGEVSRTFFMTFYIVMMVVMTIVLAFILELFLFRIQYRRKLKLEDIDDHAKQTEHVYISDEEKMMCENPDYKWTGRYIALQRNSTELQTPYLYKGERHRNKEDFSLRMYGDEVKSWLEEEQESREQTIHTMTELRRRSRPNADLEDLDEDVIPSSSFSIPVAESIQEAGPQP